MDRIKSFFSNFSSCKTWRLLLVISFAWLVIFQPFNPKGGFKVIEWDVTLYYTYLPAFFIHQDLKFEKEWTNELGDYQLGFNLDENGNRYLKMTSGMAIMYSPFFLIAHGLTLAISPEMATGYTTPYRAALSFGSWIYVMFGLWLLRKVLLRFSSDKAVGWALAIVFLGTNLLHYTVWRGAMSHGYSFMLGCAFLYLMFKYIDKQKLILIISLGLVSGLLVLIRPVNAIIPMFLGVYLLLKILSQKDSFHFLHVLLFVLFALVAISPQLLIWKYQTGNWVVYSYSEEGFFFNNPQIVNGMFSFRKGWLIYSPLMVFSLIGIGPLIVKNKKLGLVVLALISSALYVTFSWWCWWYGGSFGSRPLIEYHSILAIPLVVFLQKILEAKQGVKRISLTVISLLIGISIFQNYQYQRGLIHHDSMTKEAYWKVFLLTHLTDGYYESLDTPDYEKALKGESD